MTVLLDTSVLVAAMIESHPLHLRALAWLQQIHRGEVEGVVSAHSLAEVYAVLTRLPLRPPIPPSLAWRLIQTNILGHMRVVALSGADVESVLADLADLGISGGATYDALIARVAQNEDADRLVTANPNHFQRVAPALSDRIVVP